MKIELNYQNVTLLLKKKKTSNVVKEKTNKHATNWEQSSEIIAIKTLNFFGFFWLISLSVRDLQN